MEDDDSQDELINRSASHSKGKRAVLWNISDDSDDVQEESDEGESASGEEDEDHLDGDDDDEEEEEEEGGNEEEDEATEEEEDVKTTDGAFGETSADLAGMSSDEDSDKCPICLNSFGSQPVATPESCQHYFCLDCILEWAKNANSCPVDRIAFNNIYLRKSYGGKVKKMITVQKPVKEGKEEAVDVNLEQTNCEVCGGSDHEDRLLLCDGCDAGYHMECLTPPLDSVPVEEWFCPQCELNNSSSRGSAEEHDDAESLPSTARSSISRSQSRAAGPTRAIARTQQSERVRANVNRHRITQARTSQLAPTYLIQSTWLDDTINAVVAGLNTSVYIRDFTPRVPSSHRRKTRKRRQTNGKVTSSSKGQRSKAPSKGGRRRRRGVRRTKSRQKQMLKKTATPKSRIANSLGIVKDKKGSSLPTVYRPSEQTLSSMRADIGAASLSIYGDPFDLDPFVDREDGEQRTHVTSLLEAKRRGISRSALRSHQPVARPVAAGLSRGEVPRSRVVVEAAPVPDLLGSILSGQSVLLMDSSDVVINRDGSLKATKPMMPSTLDLGGSSSVSGDASTNINPGIMQSLEESSPSHHYNGDLPEFSHNSTDRLWTQNSDHLPSFMASTSHTQPLSQSSSLPRGRRNLLPPRPDRPTPFPGHRGMSDGSPQIDILCSSMQPVTNSSSSKIKGLSSSQSQPKKTPIKPMWLDVSVLPRIPKIKRESSGFTNEDTNQGSTNTINGSRGSSDTSTTDSNGYPVTSMVGLAGDKSRQQSVDRQKGTTGHSQRHRPDGAASSSFSSSFSSSSSTNYPANQPHYSSSSSAVSFRINSSGNSWHSRRLSIPSFSASGASTQEHWRDKEEQAKKRQLHKDKQMLLASRTTVNKEQDSNNIYDPFNPTLSDSSSSDNEAESSSLDRSSHHGTHKEKASLGDKKKDAVVQRKQVKSEPQEMADEPKTDGAQESTSQEIIGTAEKNELVDTKAEKKKHVLKIKKEPGLDDAGESEKSCQTSQSSFHLFKTETPESEQSIRSPNTVHRGGKNGSFTLSTSPKKIKSETKSGSALCSPSPSTDLSNQRKISKTSKEQCSSSSETERGRKGDRMASSQRNRQTEKVKDKKERYRQSGSREQRRARSASESSASSSPERSRRKRQRSRSQSKDRRSRSVSSCSSGEHSKKKKHKQRSKEKTDERDRRDHERGLVSKDRKRARSRSTSASKSPSRSRSRSKERKNKQCSKSPPRSWERRKDKEESLSKDKRKHRPGSRDGRKDDASSRSSQKTSFSSSKNTKQLQHKKKEDCVQSSRKEQVFDKMKKPSSSTSSSKGEKESKDLRTSSQLTASSTRDMGVLKKIKKEKHPPVDMFDFLITEPLKEQEQMDLSSVAITKCTDEEEIKEESIKTVLCDIKSEMLEITPIKSEPGSPELCQLPTGTSFSKLTTLVDVKPQGVVSQFQPGSEFSAENAETAALTVSTKQEAQPPSDSDEDFNVDVMLDSLDYVKSEATKGSETCVKNEKGGAEEKIEEDLVSAVVEAKSKAPVKRVTWNIQEPEGPQPAKSASKVALYKLKLKQEGVRRPSPTVQTSTQDFTSDRDETSTSSGLDVQQLEGSPATGQAEDGDLLKKDQQYLKKLHMQERAIEEVKLAIKPFYQRRDINKDEYKEILRKAVHKVCHSKSGEINPVKVGNLVKAYVDKYKHARKHRKGDDVGKAADVPTDAAQDEA
ncbi:PHD and RING finger domain-containing protein 1 isoform X3 [Betta splendens]|uniref:PHD and RING finger domain-containing protein 1 isoform X3 n=1 Tax=Betta splendens TaxID=158456 RepID=A0A6P7MSS7_BETSP|nr:PHD and RING finger domain-containing protein 1 isoform X3 [Betta splendens]